MKRIILIISGIVAAAAIAIAITPLLLRKSFETKALEFVSRELDADVSFGAVRLSILSSFPHVTAEISNIVATGNGALESNINKGDTLLYTGSDSARLSLTDLLGGN
ncbi:MAG: hypothetical protein LBR06_09275, partial [Bacteroidales bacterium]|nr:hypothetical protein [Bacteroidales bacterium]